MKPKVDYDKFVGKTTTNNNKKNAQYLLIIDKKKRNTKKKFPFAAKQVQWTICFLYIDRKCLSCNCTCTF